MRTLIVGLLAATCGVPFPALQAVQKRGADQATLYYFFSPSTTASLEGAKRVVAFQKAKRERVKLRLVMLLDDFSVKCWGLNLDGELGIGDTANRGGDGPLGDALPPVPLGDAAVSGISAGAKHTCAVQGPTVKCWGANGSGQLGVGDAKNRGDSPSNTIAPVTF